MKKEVEKSDFYYDYHGGRETEESLLEKGHKQILGKDLQKMIANKTIYGDYLLGFKFVTDIYENGTAEGVNHVGSHNNGQWTIDMDQHILSLAWDSGWGKTNTRAYLVNGNIEFYDIDTGLWRTSFRIFKNWEER